MAARCNDTVFKPGFDWRTVERNDVGSMFEKECDHCGAKLFDGEAVTIKGQRGKKRGRACCSDGAVVLPPVEKLDALEKLWCGSDDEAKLLREHARKFNNALALAYEEVLEPELDDQSGWQPSVVIQGKLYHRVGPLSAEEGKSKAFAQLYVHDPAADNDIAEQRAGKMYLPKNMSKKRRRKAVELLKALEGQLKDVNSYVQDFVTAGEIFGGEEVVERQFVIDPDKKPADAHERRYNEYHSFHEVSVMMLEAHGGKAPKRSVKIRDRDGGLYDIDETHRAFDPLHFVLLFPRGDDGWRTGLHLRPKGPAPDNLTWDCLQGRWVCANQTESSDCNEQQNDQEFHDPSSSSMVTDDAMDEASNDGVDSTFGETVSRERMDEVEVEDEAGSSADEAEPMEEDPGSASGDEDDLPAAKKQKHNRQLSVRQFYAYRLHQREGRESTESLFRAQRLFQEYCCMAFSKQETQRIRYFETHQDQIRSDLYQNLVDAVNAHDQNPNAGELRAGKPVILPSSFTGGPRDMHARYQDAMAVVRKHGKPSFFITMTCNPQWPEIVNSLAPGQRPEDRPDLVARVFKLKLDAMMKELVEDGVFGRTVARLHVVEFQKRGLPHAHILIILIKEDRVLTADEIDAIVCAELPEEPKKEEFSDPDEYEAAKDVFDRLEKCVCKSMLHRECGAHNPKAPCMRKTGKCEKHFPKKFQPYTMINEKEVYPQYRRRSPAQGGRTKIIKWTTKSGIERQRVADSSWVCMSVESVKYLYKYVYKGPDRTMLHVTEKTKPQNAKIIKRRKEQREREQEQRRQKGIPEPERNELESFQDFRSFGSAESCWRTFGFRLYDRKPPVTALPVHLETQVPTRYKPRESAIRQAVAQGPPKTPLTQWLDYIRDPRTLTKDPDARKWKYQDFPTEHTYDKKSGWKFSIQKKRQKPLEKTIGRMNTIHPTAGQAFFLRVLLSHVTGEDLAPINAAQGDGYSFETLRNVPGRAEPAATYQEVCQLRGLLRDDAEWHTVMHNAADMMTDVAQVRELFVSIVSNNELENPRELFDTFWESMSGDFERTFRQKERPMPTPEVMRSIVLLDIEHRLESLGWKLTATDCTNPGTKQLPIALGKDDRCAAEAALNSVNVSPEPRVIRDELAFDPKEEQATADATQEKALTSQRPLLEEIIAAIDDGKGLAAFVDAPGGTGKTFCFNGLLAHVRGNGEIALAVASSGIAALLLALGRTFHSRFKAPLAAEDGQQLQISAGTALAELVIRAKLIVWDEAPMQHRFHLEALDRTLRDLTQIEEPFGGKVVVLGGDFRQTLPIVKRASRAQTVDAAMNRSSLWKDFRKFALTENMRVHFATGDKDVLAEFAEWLLRLGNGTEPIVEGSDDLIELDAACCQPLTEDDEVDAAGLIDWVFPNLAARCAQPDEAMEWLAERAVLAPLNSTVDDLNETVLDSFPGAVRTVFSADAMADDESNADFTARIPVEYLNSQKCQGMPEHALKLKPNMPLMLLRNLNPSEGLCNGTRLICMGIHANGKLLAAKIISGSDAHRGRIVLLPRIDIYPDANTYPFKWCRRQFPVRAAFSMTINKAQGQTLKRVGILLKTPCFAHGQLYVAASRVGHPDRIRFALPKDKETGKFLTHNVVYREALTQAPRDEGEPDEFDDEDYAAAFYEYDDLPHGSGYASDGDDDTHSCDSACEERTEWMHERGDSEAEGSDTEGDEYDSDDDLP